MNLASTPIDKLNSSRPLPVFATSSEHLFEFKKNKQCIGKPLHPRSSFKSAPPISRVFSRRNWFAEKPRPVSFIAPSQTGFDSTLNSKFYDSKSTELYFKQCFIIEKKLGEGSFGEVLQVRSRDNNKKYAVKRSREKFRNESDRRRKLDEVKKHERLPNHPNCIKFIKAWEERKRLYIQIELCSTSLQSFLEKHHSIPIYFVWKYFIDLLHGLQHIHSHGLIHFDVKPANIFLSEDGICKIGDFGLVIDQCNDDLLDAQEGDNKYMAPELLQGVFSEKADVFSLGIAMLEICCDLDLPSCGASWQLLRSGYFPKECTDIIPYPLFLIIRWMMTPCYKMRPTIVEVLTHPIVRSYEQRLNVNLFLNNCIFKLFQAVKSAITYFSFCIKFPFDRYFSTAVECNKSSSKLNIRHESDDSFFSDDELSANELLPSFESSFNSHCQDSSFNTPNMTPIDMHFTPTPRNSSPVAHRSSAQVLLDLSPLSHTNKRELFSKKKFVDDFDYFVTDDSDVEHGENESILFSQPRNLLDMLNEVSGSDS